MRQFIRDYLLHHLRRLFEETAAALHTAYLTGTLRAPISALDAPSWISRGWIRINGGALSAQTPIAHVTVTTLIQLASVSLCLELGDKMGMESGDWVEITGISWVDGLLFLLGFEIGLLCLGCLAFTPFNLLLRLRYRVSFRDSYCYAIYFICAAYISTSLVMILGIMVFVAEHQGWISAGSSELGIVGIMLPFILWYLSFFIFLTPLFWARRLSVAVVPMLFGYWLMSLPLGLLSLVLVFFL